MCRSSHAEYAPVPADQLTAKPSAVSWEVAGSLFVAGATSYAAVRAVRLVPGDTVAIAGAAGGVGPNAVQLARRAGATVSASPGRPTMPGSLTMAWFRSTTATTSARLRAAAPSGTSTPCWISSSVDT